jgi:RimJ/RimL family protein N-acetyltransferase
VREAEVADAEAIADVQIRSWRAEYRELLPKHVIAGFGDLEDRRRAWTRQVSRSDSPDRTWVATLDDEVVGFATAGPIVSDQTEDPRSVAEFRSMYFVEEAWGRGIARELIDEVRRHLRAAGYREAIGSIVTTNKRARRAFEKVGWEPYGDEREMLDGAVRVVLVRGRLDP